LLTPEGEGFGRSDPPSAGRARFAGAPALPEEAGRADELDDVVLGPATRTRTARPAGRPPPLGGRGERGVAGVGTTRG
jgi:hypothetical protein